MRPSPGILFLDFHLPEARIRVNRFKLYNVAVQILRIWPECAYKSWSYGKICRGFIANSANCGRNDHSKCSNKCRPIISLKLPERSDLSMAKGVAFIWLSESHPDQRWRLLPLKQAGSMPLSPIKTNPAVQIIQPLNLICLLFHYEKWNAMLARRCISRLKRIYLDTFQRPVHVLEKSKCSQDEGTFIEEWDEGVCQ